MVKQIFFKILFAIMTHYNLDINPIYIKQPFFLQNIWSIGSHANSKKIQKLGQQKTVCKLSKAFYNLKITLRLWYKWLSQFLLKKLGLKQTTIDHRIVVTIIEIIRSIVSTFLDNIKVIGVKRSVYIEKVKLEHTVAFEMLYMGPINFYSRPKFEKNKVKKTLKLIQLVYIDKILAKY